MSGESVGSREIAYLLDFYSEVEEEPVRRSILDRIVRTVPFGYHPLSFIENIADPDRRMKVRQHAAGELNDLKLIYDLETYVSVPELDLQTGVYLISRLSDRHCLTPEAFGEDLDRLAGPLARRLDALVSPTPADRLDTFIRYLFFEQGFHGNTDDYYDPENSYLTSVLSTGTGIPVSLSVLAILVGRRVGISLEGINLPGHFILRFEEGGYRTYFDSFNEGSLLSEEDCTRFMLRQGITPSAEYFCPADTATILKRMYRNLINHYCSCGDRKKEEILNRHFLILQSHTLYR